MMKSSVSGKNISLTSYDDIFSTDETRTDSEREKIVEIPLSELHPFKNHPFRVVDDEHMQETAESIKDYGVLVPGIVRPRPEGGYEIIAGHRRKRASELAGKETMPVIIRNLDDDAAIIIMVDSNLQRENILHSERAFALKMKMEAVKRQGERTDLTSCQIGTKFRADISVADGTGDSARTIQRFIRLTHLIRPLLDMVDERKIAFSPAVELSYLKPEEQTELMDNISKQQVTPSFSQAQRMKKLSQEGQLSNEQIFSILSEVKKPEKNMKQQSEAKEHSSSLIPEQETANGKNTLITDGYIKLPIEPFLKFLPKSLFQNPTPESQEKMTNLFLRMAELYKKYITRKKEQQR